MKKASDNPLQSAHASPRCSAKSKRSGLHPVRLLLFAAATSAECMELAAALPRAEAHGRYKHGDGHLPGAVTARAAVALLMRHARLFA